MGGFALAATGPLAIQAQVTTTVPVGAYPFFIAVNTVTNTTYVADEKGNCVTAINGATGATTTVATGYDPCAIAVNPVTNKIYAANYGDGTTPMSTGTMTVIDGATNDTTTVPLGSPPYVIGVNSVTNKIYVSNASSNNVTVIDGATNATTTLAAANATGGVAVNPVTNKIYVTVYGGSNSVDGSVMVIDGATNATATVLCGYTPYGIAVNTVTNKIYVANLGDDFSSAAGPGTVTVIDGATNATTSVTAGVFPWQVAVNPVTNKVYVINEDTFNATGSVTVIDGATNATTTVTTGHYPYEIAVNPVTNQVYVPNSDYTYSSSYPSNTMTVIDGATNSTTTAIVGNIPEGVAVNPVTNTVYVANSGDNTVSVISGAVTPPSPPALTSGGSSTRLINISTRAQVGTGGNILIPGLVIGGSGAETLLIRGDGPSLTQYGVSGVLAQPILSVFDSAGDLVASNTGWGTNPNPAQIAGVAAQVGAFALPSGSADCALEVSLLAGAYTVQVSGVNNTTGVALAEVYEVSSNGTRLINVSTRAQVGTGGNIIISGFVISGTGTEQLLVRADGPALTQYGVSGVLTQPSLSIVDSAGNQVASNTGWGTNSNPAQIANVASQVGAFALNSGSADCALEVSLPAGAYTVQVSGVNSTTGDALAEIYEVPQ
jgi:DNA-binding beta-propeller fold protein YncE